MSNDIQKIQRILKHKNRFDLSNLLNNSISKINVTSNFGSALFSLISYFEIYSPIENHSELKKLSQKDKQLIFESIKELYPVKEQSIEITEVNYYLDMDLKVENIVKEEKLKELKIDYISDQISKCERKITDKDFDGSITNARTLIESICIYIIESSGEQVKSKGNLIKLYKQVSDILNMDPSIHNEDFLKQITSGFFSIINGLADMRNKLSDAHGKSKKRSYKPSHRHAVLAVNSAKTISEYLYNSWVDRN